MSKDKKVEQEGAQHVIRIGTRTYRVLPKIIIEEIGYEQQESCEVVPCLNGFFQIDLSEKDATSMGTAAPRLNRRMSRG